MLGGASSGVPNSLLEVATGIAPEKFIVQIQGSVEVGVESIVSGDSEYEDAIELRTT